MVKSLLHNERTLVGLLTASLFWVWVFQVAPAIHWLDGPVLSAAGVSLSISHPPGHVLHALWTKLFSWIPFGHLAFRIHLSSLAAMTLSTAMWLSWSLRSTRDWDVWRRILLLLCLLSFFFSLLWSAQAFRAEVYPLLLLLLTLSFHAFEAGRTQSKWIYLSSFFYGLALTLHPLLALAALPLFLSRKFLRSLGFMFLGASVLLYLPLRSLRGEFGFGNLESAENLSWFLQGKLYHAYDIAKDFSFFENLKRLLELMTMESGALLFPLGVIGLFLFCYKNRGKGIRPILLLLSAIGILAGMGNFYPENPDVRGYLLFPMVVVIALGLRSVFLGLPDRSFSIWHGFGLGVGGLLMVTSLMGTLSFGSLGGDWSAHWHIRSLLKDLPAGASVSLGSFSTYTFLEQARILDGQRGDLLLEYRGAPLREKSKEAQEVWDHPRMRLWEWSVDKDREGNWDLREFGDPSLEEMVPAGWFFTERLSRNPEWIETWHRHQHVCLALMAPGALYGKEPLILNYLLHLIWLRENEKASGAAKFQELGRKLFPFIDAERVFGQ